ncbi:MAG: ABC transporter permease [Firmicutes bacterium]|nr:ABC transporter permease [Bacillota bacterium]
MTQPAHIAIKKRKRHFALRRQHFSFPYFFLSALFVVIPLVILLVYAFRDLGGAFSFSNFAKFFTEATVRNAMGRSLLLALATTAVCLALSYPVALVLANSRFNKTVVLVLLFILPMYINSLLRTLALKSVFEMIGLSDVFTRLVIAHVYDFFPFMLLPIYTVLVNMDKSYLEASNDLGGNAASTFLKVTLPLSVPGIVSGILMVFMPTVSMFAIRDIVADSDRWSLFGNSIERKFKYEETYGEGAAYAIILLAMVLVTMLVASRLNRKIQEDKR